MIIEKLYTTRVLILWILHEAWTLPRRRADSEVVPLEGTDNSDYESMTMTT